MVAIRNGWPLRHPSPKNWPGSKIHDADQRSISLPACELLPWDAPMPTLGSKPQLVRADAGMPWRLATTELASVLERCLRRDDRLQP